MCGYVLAIELLTCICVGFDGVGFEASVVLFGGRLFGVDLFVMLVLVGTASVPVWLGLLSFGGILSGCLVMSLLQSVWPLLKTL